MGIGASSNVKQIRIDQNDTALRRSSSHRERTGSGSALSALGSRIRRSAESRSSADRRLQQLRSALEASEKRALDAETRIRHLEREIATLEIRNIELAEEVTWLKQQHVHERPEIPVPPRPSTASSIKAHVPNSSEQRDLHAKLAEAEGRNQRLEEEIRKMQAKLRVETQHLEARLQDYRHDMNSKVAALETQLNYSTKLNDHLEARLRVGVSEAACKDARGAAMKEVSNSGQALEAAVNRSQLILRLSEEVSLQKERILHLEDDLLRKDLEMTKVKNVGPPLDPTRRSVTPQKEIKKIRPASAQSRQSFTARRTSKVDIKAAPPLRVDRNQEGNVDDEIEALLKSPPPEPAEAVPEEGFNPLAASTRSLPPLPSKTKYSSAEGQEPKSRTEKPGPESSLRNVYTLSEAMEPIKVLETPRRGARPQTAGAVLRRKTRAEQESLKLDLSQQKLSRSAEVSMESLTVLPPSGRRGHSAPMFFKPSTNRRHKSRKKQESTEEEADIVSLSGDSDTNMQEPKISFQEKAVIEKDVGSRTIRNRPASAIGRFRAGKRVESLNSIQSSSGVGGTTVEDDLAIVESSDDEEVKRILEVGSFPLFGKIEEAEVQKRGGALSSAKSRDSGYLGDSFGGKAAWKLEHTAETEIPFSSFDEL